MRTPLLLLLAALFACRSVPKNITLPEEDYALAPSSSGLLADFNQSVLPGDSLTDVSGFYLLNYNQEAYEWRLALIDHAVKSLDLQYFIWEDDATGSLMLDRVLDAADRGVKVRILVDDLMITGKDEKIAALTQHPNLEIRRYNPAYVRKSTALGTGVEFLSKFKKLNQRMHNKILVADNQFCIVGGRNIADDYFGLNKKFNFRDMDVLCNGSIAEEVSEVYDLFWNSDWSYTQNSLVKRPDKYDFTEVRTETKEYIIKEKEVLESFPLEQRDWSPRFNQLKKEMILAEGRVVTDHPSPGKKKDPIVASSILDISEGIENELLIESAYYIPDTYFLAWLEELDSAGISVKLLTNSLGSNDVSITNSAYRRKRIPTLERGVALYETHYFAKDKPLHETPPVTGKFLGLHSKTILIDRNKTFIGSLNLDPRSILINTEMGMIIYSDEFGQMMAEVMENDMSPENAWQATLTEKKKLRWTNKEKTVKRQPARTFGRRLEDFFFGLLPIKNQL